MRRSICPPLCVSIALFAACSDDLPGSDFDEAGGESGVMASGTSSEPSAETTALESTSEGGPMSGPMPGPHDDEGGDACGYVGEIVDDGMICFFDAEDPTEVVATIEHVLGLYAMQDTLYLRLTLDPQFVDNTYGETAIGWEHRRKGHTFRDLVGSDHGRLQLKDEDGGVLLDFQVDYLSEDASAPSGYMSLGVWGGEGKVLAGPADAVFAASTSLDRNLNERGYSSYLTDSPATDADYTPHPDAPDWDYRVVYEAWISTSIFPDGILYHACIDEIHASPSKAENDTKKVVPGPCCLEGDDCVTTDDSGGDSGPDSAGDETTDGGEDEGTTGGDDGGCPFNPDISCDGGEIPPVP